MDEADISVLRVLDGLWETYEWVPLNEVSKRLPWRRLKLKRRLKDLEEQGHLMWKPQVLKGIPGVKLSQRGQDTLAGWDLQKQGVIDDLGHIIGEGKESVVVLGLKDDEELALKFHRMSSVEFTRIKDSLAYTAIRWWKEMKNRRIRPVDVPRAKAQVEFRALEKLAGKVSVPEVLGINRHVLVMEFLGDGVAAPLMSSVNKEKWMKEAVMEEYDRAVELGIVHGDLSPFNVVVWDDLYIIDWPQAVPTNFEGSDEIEARDRKTFQKFFT